MAFASIILSLPAACSVQGPYPPMCSHVWGDSTHTVLLNWVEFKAFYHIKFPLLTNCLDSLSHRRNVASLCFFYRYFHTDWSYEVANCMPPSFLRPRCARLSTSNPYSVHLPLAKINQYLHFLSHTLVNSGVLFLCLFFNFLMTWILSKEECQDTSNVKMDLHPLLLFRLLSSGDKRDYVTYYCYPLASTILVKTNLFRLSESVR